MNRPVLITCSIAIVFAVVLLLTQNISVIDNNQIPLSKKTDSSVNHTESPMLSDVKKKAQAPKAPSQTQVSIDRIRAITEKTELQKHLVTENDQFNRYAKFNQRFEDAKQDPTLMRHAIDERVSFSEDKEYALTVWADNKFYLKDQAITVNAILQNQEEQIINTPLNASLMDDNQKVLHNFKLTPQENSAALQATLDPALLQNASTGIYKIVIEQKEYELQDSVSFILSEPNIELTGEFRDYINDNGDLIIEAQVEIAQLSGQAQSFYIQASLYSSTQVAIGATQISQTLNAGKHWLALSFDGLMILDTQESGPFELKHVSLARVTMPMQRAPLLEPNYSTQAYAYDEFH